MDKKILMVLVMGMFMISLVSAFDFDNKLFYEDNYMKVKAKDCTFWLGTCLIDGELLADFELKSHKSVDEVVQYRKGDQQAVVYYDFKKLKLIKDGLGEVEFIDGNTGEKVEKDYYFVEWKIFNRSKNKYENQCNLNANGTNVCKKEFVGLEYYEKGQWVRYEGGNDIPDRNIRLGVLVTIEEGDYVDVIWEVVGKKVDKHAFYEEGVYQTQYDTSGQVTDIWGLGANDTTLFVGDAASAVIYKYYLNGTYTGRTITTPATINGVGVYGDRIYSTSDENNLVYVMYHNGTVDFSFDPANSCATSCPQSVAIDGANIYVMDNDNKDIKNYTMAGSFIGNIDISGTGSGVTVGLDKAEDWLYFTDNNPDRVQKIYSNGTLAYTFDTSGNQSYTSGVALDDLEEVVYIGDNGNDIIDVYGSGLGLVPDRSPTVTLNDPANNTNSTVNTISFNCTAWDDFNLVNLTFILDGSDNETTTPANNTKETYIKTLSDGDHYWACRGADNNSQTTTAGVRLISIDTLDPVVSASNLTDLVAYPVPINSSWQYTASDSNINLCYYNTSDDATRQFITCNSTTTNLQWATGGNKTIQFCANDTFARETCNTEYIWVYSITETQADNPDPIGEGSVATFNFTVNLTNIASTDATLMLNGSVYDPTTSTAGTNGYYFKVDVSIPEGWGNTTGLPNDWFWNYTITGINSNKSTTTTNISVYEMAVDDCSVYAQEILNLSLRDEGGNSVINGSLGSNVEVEINITSLTDTSIILEYSNTFVNESNPRACVPLNVINNTNYTIDITIGFDSTSRVWEFWHLDDGSLNLAGVFNDHTSRNVNLMDLLTADSTSFLFNYFDVDGQAVDGSIAHVFRKYIGEGLFREVERSKADQNGDTIVHLVEEDVIYYFMITDDGEILYTSSTYTALCQEVPCTINIEEGGESAEFDTDYDLVDGGGYSINESRSTRQVSLVYSVNESATINFTLYNYNYDGTYSQVNTTSDTGLSGILTLSVPQVAGNVSFFATVIKDDVFINSEWVDFEGQAVDYFGNILSIFLGALLILTLGLMAISTGAGVLIWVMVGLFIAGALGLFATSLSTGVSIVVYLIVAGALLLWKITGGRK